jgi:hypothetical protein
MRLGLEAGKVLATAVNKSLWQRGRATNQDPWKGLLIDKRQDLTYEGRRLRPTPNLPMLQTCNLPRHTESFVRVI